MRASRITKLIRAANPKAVVRFEGVSFLVYLPHDSPVEERERVDRVVTSLSTTDEKTSGSGWWENATILGVGGTFRCARFPRPQSKAAKRWAAFGLYIWFFVWIGGCQSALSSQRDTWWLEGIAFNVVVVLVGYWLIVFAVSGENILYDFPRKLRSVRRVRKKFSEAEMKAYYELLTKAAGPPGDAEAQFELGNLYLNDLAPEQKAKHVPWNWFRESAKKGHIKAMRMLYQGYRNADGGQETALMYLRQAAEAGDADSQNDLALELFHCKQQDRSKIVSWYRKAALQGHSTAAWSLGLHYEEGDGVPKNIEKAIEWYRIAAMRGHELAQKKVHQLSPKAEAN